MESDIQEESKCVFCDEHASYRIGKRGLCFACRKELGDMMGETIVKLVQQTKGFKTK